MVMFKELSAYPGYRVNASGEVIGKRGWKLKPTVTNKGYHRVNLRVDGIVMIMLLKSLTHLAKHSKQQLRSVGRESE